jgi:putative hydrolase of the HAD superfamily
MVGAAAKGRSQVVPDRPVRAAVFDLGRVVIDVREEEIPRHWARASGADLDRVVAVFRGDAHYQRMERGEISIDQYHAIISAQIDGPLSLDDFVAGWNSIFFGVLPDMEPLLAELSGCVRLVALSNTNETHTATWRDLYRGVLAHFERVFVSHEMGLRKPETECYRRVLDYLGLPAGEIVFIDDKAANVAAAESLGMRGIVAETAGQLADRLRRMGVPLGR